MRAIDKKLVARALRITGEKRARDAFFVEKTAAIVLYLKRNSKRAMPTPIRIIVGDVAADAELFDTVCARKVVDALPVETRPQAWGDEFYFEIPVASALDETAASRVAVGDIGYWPPGTALALFFGPTPLSRGPEPVPASEVNLIGRITSDPAALKKARGAPRIRIERVLGKGPVEHP